MPSALLRTAVNKSLVCKVRRQVQFLSGLRDYDVSNGLQPSSGKNLGIFRRNHVASITCKSVRLLSLVSLRYEETAAMTFFLPEKFDNDEPKCFFFVSFRKF